MILSGKMWLYRFLILSNILCLSLLWDSHRAFEVLNEPQLSAQLSADTQRVVSGPIRTRWWHLKGAPRTRDGFPQLRNSASLKLQQEAEFRDRLMESHYAFWLRSLSFVLVVWEHRASSPRRRKTVISALCSLCCTSDSQFSHFLAFIHFNSSASSAISLAILVC